jgi:hypothetical protein
MKLFFIWRTVAWGSMILGSAPGIDQDGPGYSTLAMRVSALQRLKSADAILNQKY